MIRTIVRSLLVAVTVSATGLVSASAATVTWTAPVANSATSDISTEGTLVDSILFSGGNKITGATGNAFASTTVNGVTFAKALNPTTNVETSVAGLISTQEDNDQNTGRSPTSDPNYNHLLSGESYTNPGDYYNITLSGLTAGHTYELQAWVDDSTVTNPGQNDLYLYGGAGHTDGVLVPNGDHITGYFTADATTETLAWGGNPAEFALGNDGLAYGTIDALQVREVPEPSSLVALGGLSAIGLLCLAPPRQSFRRGSLWIRFGSCDSYLFGNRLWGECADYLDRRHIYDRCHFAQERHRLRRWVWQWKLRDDDQWSDVWPRQFHECGL